MLTHEMNESLTRVGPGTQMGEYLRRYWHPIAGLAELEANPTKPVRLLGEDLVLYRDLGGRLGLVARRCPHRGADLSYGYVEACGLRCNYHGWLFGEAGNCLEAPFEDTVQTDDRFRKRVKLKAYPVQVKAGLVFAYLGPAPAPLLPDWEPFSRPDGFVQVVTAEIPCNWFQCQENSIDPVHFEWMHANWSRRLRDQGEAYGPAHLKLAFEEFEHGFLYKRIQTNTDEHDPLWTIGRVFLWPNGFFLGNHFEWRVPVDDETTLSIAWIYDAVPEARRPFAQQHIPCWQSPIRDPVTGRWVTTHVINQDIVGWVGQGAIADRTREHLGASDRGIAMIRRRFIVELKAMAEGAEPKGLVRDPAANIGLRLPMANRVTLGAEAITAKFILAAGQPPEVHAAHEAAMGHAVDNSGLV